MKKIIFTSMVAIISLTTFAQGNSGKNKNQNGNSSYKKDKDRDDDRNYDRYEDTDKAKKNKKNRRYNEQDGRDRRDENIGNKNKYSKNTPRKVGDAFRRDFPNANNVTWTKNSGSWTATFNNGGLIPVDRAVTYRANGERVLSNGIF